MLLLLCSLAVGADLPKDLPNIDVPARTGQKLPDDAGVVVGIEDYFVLPDVPHAERDAQSFADFLVYTRGVPNANLHHLGQGTTREQVFKS
ncbi:MAG: hypothetical protein HN348_34415, partial [Proteobacteria bacterium]|nr:hypothetical protein [Pseudomonadota bacterium]